MDYVNRIIIKLLLLVLIDNIFLVKIDNLVIIFGRYIIFDIEIEVW